MIAFWDVAPCSLVEVAEVHTSEMSVYFNETTWHYIPEGYHIHTCRHENVKSNVTKISFSTVKRNFLIGVKFSVFTL
jgi:hypothetical protein